MMAPLSSVRKSFDTWVLSSMRLMACLGLSTVILSFCCSKGYVGNDFKV
jgi:hypothetical protein